MKIHESHITVPFSHDTEYPVYKRIWNSLRIVSITTTELRVLWAIIKINPWDPPKQHSWASNAKVPNKAKIQKSLRNAWIPQSCTCILPNIFYTLTIDFGSTPSWATKSCSPTATRLWWAFELFKHKVNT